MPLKEKIVAGKFIVLGEFEPPKGSDFDPFVKEANLVRGRMDALGGTGNGQCGSEGQFTWGLRLPGKRGD